MYFFVILFFSFFFSLKAAKESTYKWDEKRCWNKTRTSQQREYEIWQGVGWEGYWQSVWRPSQDESNSFENCKISERKKIIASGTHTHTHAHALHSNILVHILFTHFPNILHLVYQRRQSGFAPITFRPAFKSQRLQNDPWMIWAILLYWNHKIQQLVMSTFPSLLFCNEQTPSPQQGDQTQMDGVNSSENRLTHLPTDGIHTFISS